MFHAVSYTTFPKLLSATALGSRMMVYARLVAVREPHKGVILQSATGEELRRRRTLLPSVLDKAFKGEL